MRLQHVEPNMITFNAAISACEKGYAEGQFSNSMRDGPEGFVSLLFQQFGTCKSAVSACESHLDDTQANQMMCFATRVAVLEATIIAFSAASNAGEVGGAMVQLFMWVQHCRVEWDTVPLPNNIGSEKASKFFCAPQIYSCRSPYRNCKVAGIWSWAPPPARTDGEAANPGPRQRKGGPRSLESRQHRTLRHTFRQ